jgi:hypothetical protein
MKKKTICRDPSFETVEMKYMANNANKLKTKDNLF